MDPCVGAPKTIRFGLFEADLATGELRKHGRIIRLQEQPFQVLALLIRRAGQVVPREELKKALWSADTFVEFDQGVNTAIKKIRQALSDSAENPRFIETLPRKGYRFIAPVAGLEVRVPSAGPAPTHSGRPLSFWILTFGTIAVIAAGAAWLIGTRRGPQATSATPVPLTTYQGQERQASFSPDGNQVAFAWNGEKQDNFDIYVKLIGSESLLRITSNPAPDFSPAWSPDGRSIAFLRATGPDRTGVFLTPVIGGAERKIAEVNYFRMDPELAWSPDGKWLATIDGSDTGEKPGLILLSPEDGEKHRVTSPSGGARNYLEDKNPAFSPEGRTLAFVRQTNPGVQDLFMLPLSANGRPSQAPTQVTFLNRWTRTPVWSPDGRAIVFSSGPYGGSSWLWRLRIPVGGPPERLSALGDSVDDPAISGQRHLAYTRSANRVNTWRLQLSRGAKPSAPVRLLSSTRVDYNAQYSPDGKRIAFHSTRSGGSEIWVCDSDGSNARQLTFLQSPITGSPRWSPDGTRIVFDSNVEGQFDLYTISADGGKPLRLTINPADDAVGSWSRDGKWIYFASDRSGEWQVWKMPAQGGVPVQVTKHGGYVAFESPDSRFVYYSKGVQDTSLWRVPASGGEEQQMLDSITWLNFVVVPDGIYFAPGRSVGTPSIQFFSFRSRTSSLVAPIAGTPSLGLSVSPDGRQILYSQTDQQDADLMLLENFR